MKHLLRLSLFLPILWLLASCQEESDTNDEDGLLANDLQTGSSAEELLSGDTYTHMVLEVQYAEGFEPPEASVASLESFFNQYCRKPEGIEVVTTQIARPAQDVYTLEDLQNIEDENREHFNDENSIAIYVFIAGGNYAEGTDTTTVLGLAYRNTSFAVFQKPIEENTGGFGRPSEQLVTSSIFRHEASHLMGLVNIGTPMVEDHEDEDHAKHCNNEDCLMYWALNRASAMNGLFGNNEPPELGSQCEADLRANGGK